MTEPRRSLVCCPAARLTQVEAYLPASLVQLVDSVPLYAQLTPVWAQYPETPVSPPAHALPQAVQLHRCNFRLWHTENGVRRPEAPEHFIAQSKRAIDTLNQQRHDYIEHLDTWLFRWLYEQQQRARAEAELHSETPGNLLDRLSILTLKVYYMGYEAERRDTTAAHRQRCRQRLAVLHEQHNDLHQCLRQLCLALWAGDKVFKIYRQFKMYNDPALNPEIYRYQASSKDASDGPT